MENVQDTFNTDSIENLNEDAIVENLEEVSNNENENN